MERRSMSGNDAKGWLILATVLGLLSVAPALRAVAADLPAAPAGHDNPAAAAQTPADGLPVVSRTVINYPVPAVALVRDDGRPVRLTDELNDGRPVVLNFIYTTCTGICPLASHVFAELQRELGTERDSVHLVSISIDPEEDTPQQLRTYARRHGAGPSWQHYTGTVAASLAVQRAFDVYRGDKMGHTPVTLVRAAPGAPWVRFDGFATADLLLQEVRGSGLVTAAVPSSRQ
jgi:protein SCO1